MKTIFYLIGVLAVLWELYTLFNLKHVHQAKLALQEPNRSDVTGTEALLGLLHIGYWIWVTIGMLFTTQSPLFALLFIFALIANSKLREYIIVTALDAVFSLVVLLLIYMCTANSISSFQIVKSWILK